jgi:hypothetical protein
VSVDLANLPANSCLRKKIYDYHPSDSDKIRRAYLLRSLFFTTFLINFYSIFFFIFIKKKILDPVN